MIYTSDEQKFWKYIGTKFTEEGWMDRYYPPEQRKSFERQGVRFNKKGHIGFLGHGDYVEFRNLRVKQL